MWTLVQLHARYASHCRWWSWGLDQEPACPGLVLSCLDIYAQRSGPAWRWGMTRQRGTCALISCPLALWLNLCSRVSQGGTSISTHLLHHSTWSRAGLLGNTLLSVFVWLVLLLSVCLSFLREKHVEKEENRLKIRIQTLEGGREENSRRNLNN